jgi:SAM-dependent methyltransferase
MNQKKSTDLQYDDIAEEYSKMLVPTKEHILVPTFMYLIQDIGSKSVIDLGCGSGFFTRIFADKFPSEISGMDISKKLVQIAKEIEDENPTGINYFVGDVLNPPIKRKFDFVSSVFLLNYSRTKEELSTMCNNIFNMLIADGIFYGITTDPKLKPMTEFEYGRRYVSLSERDCFRNGEMIRADFAEEGKIPFSFYPYYWSRSTYETQLKDAGFKEVEWVEAKISKESMDKYGINYWGKFRQNPAIIGIRCRK